MDNCGECAFLYVERDTNFKCCSFDNHTVSEEESIQCGNYAGKQDILDQKAEMQMEAQLERKYVKQERGIEDGEE